MLKLIQICGWIHYVLILHSIECALIGLYSCYYTISNFFFIM